MPGMTDSAIFFRMWDLFDTLREPEVIAILNNEQKEAPKAFRQDDRVALEGDSVSPAHSRACR